ncbi:leucyl/phenylalanyl-tRNA--protein transferase [candidate division KSB1 bacterium]|nr:leucyl/phenylalanyl-tRNA--protein transferase [candidate division KSB1 bacterium]
MPIYRLTKKKIIFPPPDLADPDGLLAIGGDLCPKRLLMAYRMGIFPWFSPGEPILWWSPDPRLVLEPTDIHISKSLQKLIRQQKYEIRLDTAFPSVIEACANAPRKIGNGTWITDEMQVAYIQLHELGFAHSVECWQEDNLVGGLYGVSIGRIFCGESMFSKLPNTSKITLVALANLLKLKAFHLIDCQLPTTHLISLGAFEMKRSEFLKRLEQAIQFPSLIGKWSDWEWQFD